MSTVDNKQKPTISAVIPAYNVERWVGLAIDSVLKQTLLPKEIIVVDDGSTDRTRAIAEGYGGIVKVVHHENRGLPAARNPGIRAATGDFIALLDSDDEWYPEHLARATTVLMANPRLCWYSSGYEVREEDGAFVGLYSYPELVKGVAVIEDYFHAACKWVFMNSTVVVFSRSVAHQVGLFNEEIRQNGEDLDFFFRFALKCPRVGYDPGVAGLYRRRRGSIMHATRPDAPRYLRRILITMGALDGLSCALTNRTDCLVNRWIREVTVTALASCERETLVRIRDCFGKRVPLPLRGLSAICRSVSPRLWTGIWGAVRRFR